MRRNLVLSLVITVAIAALALGLTLVSGSSPQLGLDLQGGASVVLQPKESVDSGVLDQTIVIIRNRVDALGVAEPEITRQGDAILVELPGVKDQERALEIVGQTAELRFRPVLEVLPPDASQPVPSATTTVTVSDTGATDTSVASIGLDHGIDHRQHDGHGADRGRADDTAGRGRARRRGRARGEGPRRQCARPLSPRPHGVDRRWCRGGRCAAQPEHVGRGASLVTFREGEVGIDGFNQLAERCYNRDATCPSGQIAITLDSVVRSAPAVQTPTFEADDVSITGSFSEREAKNLALVLDYGALPVQLEPQAVQTVSASLGQDSLKAGVVSGLIGLLLVVIFMLVYYRRLGLVVPAGLCVSGALMWAIISWLGETRGLALTLAGVTGIIVSIGVTVDSYVVYFERLKDDVRLGRTLRSSAEKSFKGAYRTILAADGASLIGALLLYWLTVGSVRGFAFFLALSTLLDMFVSFFFTRPAVILMSRRKAFAGTDVLGIHQGEAMGATSDETLVGASR